MRMIPTRVLVLLVAGGICGHAHADGKFYGERIPPDIPYQRAFLLFHEGSQTLVLQSKYESTDSGTDANSLGWVVPAQACRRLPAQMPTLLFGSSFIPLGVLSQGYSGFLRMWVSSRQSFLCAALHLCCSFSWSTPFSIRLDSQNLHGGSV